MKQINYLVGLFLAFLIAVPVVATLTSGNVSKVRPNIYEFEQDTLAASDTAYYLIPQQIKSRVGMAWQLTATSVSGTPNALFIIQESCWSNPTRWYNKDTITASAAGNYLVELQYRSSWTRGMLLTDTTTQSTVFHVAATAVDQ
jgi:hypothetical protein